MKKIEQNVTLKWSVFHIFAGEPWAMPAMQAGKWTVARTFPDSSVLTIRARFSKQLRTSEPDLF